ncbi:MAG TPA: hypothetical protein VL096_06445, partial [Pirellulaceae bacterium]|nr:hypothetical protein [Pirellulaceae bacterium]
MQSLLRITLLVACAAAGVGVAISLALTPPVIEQAESGESTKRWLPLPTEQKAKPKIAKPLEPVAPAPAPPAPAVATHFPTIVPIQMPYQPPVASQIDTLEKGLQQLQEATQRNGDAVVEAIQNLRQNPAQPVPPANNNPAPARLVDPLAQPEEMPAPRGISQVQRGEGDNTLTLNLQNSDIRTVLQDISAQAGLNILASKNVTGTVSAVLTDVDIYTALDVILKSTGYIARREGKFIFVGTPEDLQDMDRTQDQLATRIYRPNYVRAMELQQLITPLLSQTVGKISVSSPSEIDIPADVVKTGGDGFAGTDVLIVRDYEMVLRQIDQMVAEVDTQPKQVAIEAMILSVKLEDEFQFGVDFQLLRDKNNVRLVSGSPLANLA